MDIMCSGGAQHVRRSDGRQGLQRVGSVFRRDEDSPAAFTPASAQAASSTGASPDTPTAPTNCFPSAENTGMPPGTATTCGALPKSRRFLCRSGHIGGRKVPKCYSSGLFHCVNSTALNDLRGCRSAQHHLGGAAGWPDEVSERRAGKEVFVKCVHRL